MDENAFKEAVAAVNSKSYNEHDLKVIRQWLNDLSKKEKKIVQNIENLRNEFVKKKGILTSELKTIRKDIKKVQKILTF